MGVSKMANGAKKLRILHIIPTFGAGGAEFLVVNLCRYLVNLNFDVGVATLYPPKGINKDIAISQSTQLSNAGVEVFHLNKRIGLDIKVIFQLYNTLDGFRPDIIHTHCYVLRYTLLPTLFCRIPVRVHTVHSVAPKEVDWVGKMVHWIAFRVGGVVPVSVSQEVAKTVQALYGRGIHTPVIYNGIPTRHFISNALQDDAKKKHVILLHIGRFAPQKNHILLVEAFAMALKEYPAMRLWLVGDGLLRDQVETLVKEKGLERNVTFLGIREDVPKLLSEADVFLLPSEWEGVPLTVLEAMAAGKPVIATAVGGVPELVKDGVSGILVPSRNHGALAKAILCLAKDPDLRQRMGKAGQQRAIEHFDISRTAKGYEALYLKLLRERGRA